MKRLKGWIGVILIWFFGVICGSVVATGGARARFISLVEGGPEKIVDAVVDRLKEDLKLDAGQKEMLQQILIDTRIKLSAIRQQTQPQFEATIAESEQRVRGILNPAQVKKFDEIVTKGRQRWKSTESAAEKSRPASPSAAPSATPRPESAAPSKPEPPKPSTTPEPAGDSAK
jgi:hypothetical protein